MANAYIIMAQELEEKIDTYKGWVENLMKLYPEAKSISWERFQEQAKIDEDDAYVPTVFNFISLFEAGQKSDFKSLKSSTKKYRAAYKKIIGNDHPESKKFMELVELENSIDRAELDIFSFYLLLAHSMGIPDDELFDTQW